MIDLLRLSQAMKRWDMNTSILKNEVDRYMILDKRAAIAQQKRNLRRSDLQVYRRREQEEQSRVCFRSRIDFSQ